MLVIFLIVVIVVFFIYLDKYLEIKKERETSRSIVDNPLPDYLEPNPIKKVYSNDSFLLKKYNEYLILYSKIEYYRLIERILIKKIALCKRWMFSDLSFYEKQLQKTVLNISIYQDKITRFKVNRNKTLKFVDFSLWNKLNKCSPSDYIKSFFKRDFYCYKSNGWIIFHQDKIIYLSEDYKKFNYFELDDVSVKYTKSIVKQRNYRPENEELVSQNWRYETKNGQKDRRYNNNYLIYTVNKYKVYFDKIPEVKIEVSCYKDVQLLQQAFLSSNTAVNEDLLKKIKNSDNIINNSTDISQYVDYQFNKSDTVYHPKFKYGKIISEKSNIIEIKFNEFGTKKISSDYEELKYVSESEFYDNLSRLGANLEPLHKTSSNTSNLNGKSLIQKTDNVYHPAFRYGKIINETEKILEINFNEFGTKKIMSDYKELKYVSESEFNENLSRLGANLELLHKISSNTSNLNGKSLIQKTDNVYHPTFRYGKIINETEKILVIDFIEFGIKKIINDYNRLRFVSDNEYNANFIKQNRLNDMTISNDIKPIVEIKPLDIIYDSSYGYMSITEIM
jgi:RNase P/RNase MRP subunit p29